MVFLCSPIRVFADTSEGFDGTGSITSGGASPTTGGYKLTYTDTRSVFAYRCSFYDASGKQQGYCVDLYLKNNYKNCVRVIKDNKKSHEEYYKDYLKYGDIIIPTGTTSYATYEIDCTDSADEDSIDIPQDPTEIETWIDREKAKIIAGACNVEANDNTSYYIMIEPMFYATLADVDYCLTTAEYAIYQAGQYGWNKYPTYTETSYAFISGRLGTVFPRWLYTEETYDVFKTETISSSDLATHTVNKKTLDIIKLGTDSYDNTAADILKHQIGMGIFRYNYTQKSYYLDINGLLDGGTSSSINGYGTVDVYINGERVADDVTDYWTQWPNGTSYEIKDIKSATGRSYQGVDSGSLSGVIKDGTTSVRLIFNTDNVLTVNYYSNCATNGFDEPLNEIGADKNVLVKTAKFYKTSSYPNGLHDYTYKSAATYLERKGFVSTGNWYTESGIIINQNTAFNNGEELANALGVDISSGGAVVNVYAQWKVPVYFDVNYNNVSTNIFSPVESTSLTTIKKLPNKAGVTYSVDGDTGIITLNGSTSDSFGLSQFFNMSLNQNDIFTVSIECVGGSYSSQKEGSLAGSLAFEFLTGGEGNVAPRQCKDFILPKSSGYVSDTITVTQTTAEQSNGFYFWIWHSNGFVFDNYQFKIKVEKISYATEFSPNAMTVLTGETYGELPTPIREGYIFLGWYTNSENGTLITPESIFTNNEPVTLFARWSIASLVVKFDKNNGIGNMPEQIINYGNNDSLNECLFKRYGYIFSGWNTEPNASGVMYSDKEIVSSENYLNNNVSVLVLYATWKPTNYSVRKARFINASYHPSVSALYIDDNGCFKGRKQNGVIYYVDKNDEITQYVVDASVGIKVSINDDGSYTIKPLSKWLTNADCNTLLFDCLNTKRISQTWKFVSDIIKIIREKLENNVPSFFFSNEYGFCKK